MIYKLIMITLCSGFEINHVVIHSRSAHNIEYLEIFRV